MNEPTIILDDELYARLADRVETTGYDSIDEYVAFVLEEVLYQLDEPNRSVEHEEVEDRLEALGYVE